MPYEELPVGTASPRQSVDPLDAPWVQALDVPRGPGAAPAHWIPDSSVRGCMVCGARFTLLVRRHHCRRCGACVCHGCSTTRLPVNLLPEGRARKPPSGELKRAVEKRVEVLVHDTNLQYVRCCDRCASIVDGNLKSAIRGKFAKQLDEDAKDDIDAISV